MPGHTHIPISRESHYPGGGELRKEYWHTHDTVVALSYAAAATWLDALKYDYEPDFRRECPGAFSAAERLGTKDAVTAQSYAMLEGVVRTVSGHHTEHEAGAKGLRSAGAPIGAGSSGLPLLTLFSDIRQTDALSIVA